jgi:hypothetical protein
MFEAEFAKLPLEPPRPVESLPGLRLRGAIPRAALVLPPLFVAFFLIIPLSIMNADPAMRLSMGSTESADGRVVSATSAAACRGEASHRLTYAFPSRSGREYRGGATLCEESPYYSLHEGDAIEVRYLRSDPTVNALPGSGANQPPPLAFFFFMPVFFLAMFALMFWPPVREVLRARRLYKSGRLATGKVVFVKRRSNAFWPGLPFSSASEVYIAFETVVGTKREAVASCNNGWLIGRLVPGAIVHVAYSDGNSARVALLEAFLR